MALFAGGMFALLTGAVAYLYFSFRLDETMATRNWDLPSKLHPAALVLEIGNSIPVGPLSETLEAMGYRYKKPVRNPGEYREAGPGHYYVRARAAWPGLPDVEPRTLDVRLENGFVSGLRVFKGPRLQRAALPPVPFAELRIRDQESRRLIEIEDVPRVLSEAIVAIEDKRFYQHLGVDPRGIARALFSNLVRGRRAQGGSTLTQQLAKNYFLTHEKTYQRKLKELFLALAIERKYSKDEILELYMNEIYLGQRGSVPICGVGQAAYVYFSKEVSQLKLHEAALLAGLVQAPNAYAPDRHAKRARARRDMVLEAMFDQGRIDKKQLEEATARALGVRPGPYVGTRTAPFLVDFISEQMGAVFPDVVFSAEGYTIETTIDLRVQHAAKEALESGLRALDGVSRAPLEGAVVVLQPSSGRILAMVGGRNYGASQFNRATQAFRQPGSAFKPLMVLAASQALGTSLLPSTLLDDSPLTLTVSGKRWEPHNYDKQYRGEVTLRRTIEDSLNVPAVRLAQQTGFQTVADFYKRLGLPRTLKPLPSIALGAFEVSPLETAGAFTVIAAEGRFARPYAIQRVFDRSGDVIYQGKPDRHTVATPAQAFIAYDMMRGVLTRGTAKSTRSLGYTFAAAGKTGTSNDYRDAWFVGFDRDILTVVWVGSDSSKPTGLTGARAALPIWVQIMRSVRENEAPSAVELPSALVRVDVCAESLERRTDKCPEALHELYWAGEVPTRPCSIHATPVENVSEAIDRLKERVRAWFSRTRLGPAE